jgi:hypothetical protein
MGVELYREVNASQLLVFHDTLIVSLYLIKGFWSTILWIVHIFITVTYLSVFFPLYLYLCGNDERVDSVLACYPEVLEKVLSSM